MNTTIKTQDGLTLQVYSNKIENAKGTIIMLHGMGEHFGRYAHMVNYFSSINYNTVGIDLRGHGKSEGPRGHAPSFDYLMSDIQVLYDKAKELFPNSSMYLFGHSMGGNLAANFTLRKNPDLEGLILSSPYLRLAFDPPKFKVVLARAVSGIIPGLTQSTELDVTKISKDKSVVEAYKNDALNHDKMSAAFFVNVHFAGLYPIAHANDLTIRTLIYHGDGDQITSHKGSEEFAMKAGDLCTFKLWPGGYHEMHNEAEKQQVFEYIGNWLR